MKVEKVYFSKQFQDYLIKNVPKEVDTEKLKKELMKNEHIKKSCKEALKYMNISQLKYKGRYIKGLSYNIGGGYFEITY